MLLWRTSLPANITGLLKAWSTGNSAAQEQLIPLVYDELRRVARAYRRKIGVGDTLQTTALVHEAYMRLVDIPNVDWNDRVHFFALSAKLMRRILVDAARARGAAKRGGPVGVFHHPNLDEIPAPDSERASVLIALDEALSRLTEFDPRRARIVELRVFGGLSVEETTHALGLSPRSVIRDWNVAKAWLMRELSGQNPSA